MEEQITEEITEDIAVYDVKDQSFAELVSGFTEGQRNYLYYLACGFRSQRAIKLIGRQCSSLGRVWRGVDRFSAVEKYIEEHPLQFREEAFKLLISTWTPIAQQAFMQLLEKGLEWERVDAGDKPYVFKAIMFVLDQGNGPGIKEGYEEMLFKIRRRV